MAHSNDKNLNRNKNKLMAFFGLPLIFLILSYSLIYIISAPIINPMIAIFDMITGDVSLKESSGHDMNDVLNAIEIGKTQENTVTVDKITFPEVGEPYASIFIEGTGVDCMLYYGDNNASLKKGPGQYTGSMMPGFGSTTIIGAHVTSHFRGLQKVKLGDTIKINTTYGAYEYEVSDLKVVDKDDKTAYDLSADYDNIVLYTCYPFGTYGLTPQRYFVYGKYKSGPKVIFNAVD